MRASQEPAQIKELGRLATLCGGPQPSEVGRQVAILGDEIANAVLPERTKPATLRVGELCGEGVPTRGSRGDDDIAFPRRPALLACGDAAGSRAPL